MRILHPRILSFFALASLFTAARSGAQATQTSSAPLPVAAAAPVTGSISVDGKLDEAAWSRATPITEFRQQQPREGAPASERTEVRVLYDERALYIGARMYDSLGKRGIIAPVSRRDQLLDSNGNNGSFNSLTTDKLVVILDPYHNKIDQAWFEVNPAGVRGDQFNGDPSWDPIWEAETHVDSLGWTAEMRIPYSQLRFSRDSLQNWGMQILRYTDRRHEQDMWSFRKLNEAGGPAYYGSLTGLTIGSQPRQLEILPYVESREQFKYSTPGDPYHSTSYGHTSAGADIKYLLTPSLALDATINPDFGQVEVDPATINLSAYETYYQEKRPFFVAGNNAFDFGNFNCFFCSNTSSLDFFYSRRIGRPPQLNGYVSDLADFADTPDNTMIIGAAKITGRTSGGYTVGLLDAVTNRETARYMTGGSELTQQVEPLTNYFVGRVKKDLNQGSTTIGVGFTSTLRQLNDSVVSDKLRSHAEAGGMDWNHRWSQRRYSWIGSFLVSDVAGSTSVIDATQQSSAHYFQRPDRKVTTDGLFDASYNPNANSLQGYGFYTRLAKDNGDWLWETAQNWRSPGFEVNDLSFLGQADYKWMNANIGHQWSTPGSWYRSVIWLAGAQQRFNYDGDRTDAQAQAYYENMFLNYWKVRSFAIYHPTVLDDQLTRGGPVVMRTGYKFGMLEISSDARQRAVADFTIQVGRGINSDTHTLILQPGLALKPSTNVFISLSPTFVADEDAAQYVETIADPTATSFYGNRYVFAFIKTRTVSLDTRVNWTFNPNLTLQLFAQPFIASGAYSAFREFAAPRTYHKVIYGKDVGTITRTPATATADAQYTVDPDGAGPAASFSFTDPDFTFRSLIGNAVLRWEYRPGSTMFFVWTQSRTGNDPTGNFDFAAQRSAIFRDRPTNVFQVKVNYWIGR
ncbi:MAG TPA: DUF5916 domain-containing protein [Gemmatimonadaceae bacterium]|nr:DUF5916 domain-containing protein [Gemmatimonadaceae bacterium]